MTQHQVHHRKAGTESEEARLTREAYERLPMVERCARCPRWSFRGSAADCLEAGRAHRASVHPETVGWKKPVKKAKVAAVVTPDDVRVNAELSERKSRAKIKTTPVRRKKPKRSEIAKAKEIRPRSLPVKSCGRTRLISDEQLVALHERHVAGESVHEIATSEWARLGYKNENACSVSIRSCFRRAGLPLIPHTVERKRARAAVVAEERLTAARVAAAAAAYRAGISVEAVAEVAWERWGFPGRETCRRALRSAITGRVEPWPTARPPVPIPLLNRDQVDALLEQADRARIAA